jgi:hypothetical protein
MKQASFVVRDERYCQYVNLLRCIFIRRKLPDTAIRELPALAHAFEIACNNYLAAPYGPGYYGPGYYGALPPPVASGPPPGDAIAYCMQRFRSFDPSSGTYLGTTGIVIPVHEATLRRPGRVLHQSINPARNSVGGTKTL